MKVKEGFILRKVGIQNVVAAVGKASESFDGMLRLNDTGAFLFGLLEQDTTEDKLVEGLLEAYDVDEKTAQEGARAFLERLREADALEELSSVSEEGSVDVS